MISYRVFLENHHPHEHNVNCCADTWVPKYVAHLSKKSTIKPNETLKKLFLDTSGRTKSSLNLSLLTQINEGLTKVSHFTIMESHETLGPASTLHISHNTNNKCVKSVALTRNPVSKAMKTYHIRYSEEIFFQSALVKLVHCLVSNQQHFHIFLRAN